MDGHSSDRVERFNNLVRSLEVCERRRLPVSSEELARMAGYGEDGRNVKSAKARMKKDIESLNKDFYFDIDFDIDFDFDFDFGFGFDFDFESGISPGAAVCKRPTAVFPRPLGLVGPEDSDSRRRRRASQSARAHP